MNNNVSRLRVFAGPNGSGKTTLVNQIKKYILEKKSRIQLGFILNSDALEETLSSKHFLQFDDYGIYADDKEFSAHIKTSEVMRKSVKPASAGMFVKENVLVAKNIPITSYLAASIVEFLRNKLLNAKQSFSYETVMSHPSKVNFIKKAKESGYKTYLYFVATESPDINISRVKARIEKGGHPVSSKKIKQRYYRSLLLLPKAICEADKAYIFDNSSELLLIATAERSIITLTGETTPCWFKENVLKQGG